MMENLLSGEASGILVAIAPMPDGIVWEDQG